MKKKVAALIVLKQVAGREKRRPKGEYKVRYGIYMERRRRAEEWHGAWGSVSVRNQKLKPNQTPNINYRWRNGERIPTK